MGKVTPESVFTGSKPEVSRIRIFGNKGYCHIPKEKRKKLDQTAENGFLMGYSENAKAYRIYIPKSRNVVVRRDVKFLEERAFRKSQEMATNMKFEEDPLVRPQRPIEERSSASPRHNNSEGSSSDEEQEEEQVRPPITDGRPSRELQQILRDAEGFVGAPREGKRIRKQPDKYQALVAQVGEPCTLREEAQHQVWVDAMVEEYSSIMTNDV